VDGGVCAPDGVEEGGADILLALIGVEAGGLACLWEGGDERLPNEPGRKKSCPEKDPREAALQGPFLE